MNPMDNGLKSFGSNSGTSQQFLVDDNVSLMSETSDGSISASGESKIYTERGVNTDGMYIH